VGHVCSAISRHRDFGIVEPLIEDLRGTNNDKGRNNESKEGYAEAPASAPRSLQLLRVHESRRTRVTRRRQTAT
jgi:hypothetical protein